MTVKEMWAKHEALQSAFMEAKDSTPDDVLDALEDELENLEADIAKQSHMEIQAKYDSNTPKIRPNEWTRNFLESFEDCQSRSVSPKQAEIFERCLRYVEQKQSFSSFHGKSFVIGFEYAAAYNGKIYTLKKYSGKAYLTKRDIVQFPA